MVKVYTQGRIYKVWPTFLGSSLVIHLSLKSKSAVILPWRAISKNFSPTKVGGNGSLFTPGHQAELHATLDHCEGSQLTKRLRGLH